jgi:dihydrofolate reductase
MGRTTYESIGRPLPQRHNIVLTRDESRDDPRVTVINDAQALMDLYTTALDEDLYIIGGAQIYQLFLSLADQIELTIIKREVEGDTFFPVFEGDFDQVEREEHDEFDFVTYVRTVSE